MLNQKYSIIISEDVSSALIWLLKESITHSSKNPNDNNYVIYEGRFHGLSSDLSLLNS